MFSKLKKKKKASLVTVFTCGHDISINSGPTLGELLSECQELRHPSGGKEKKMTFKKKKKISYNHVIFSGPGLTLYIIYKSLQYIRV